jgi:enolase-phosphatase E1
VTIRLAERGTGAVLLDIEGTTTPVRFVHDVLFPFARAGLDAWLDAHASSPEHLAIARQLADEHAADRARGESVPPGMPDSTPEGRAPLRSYVTWLMDGDRKSPGLKQLQGFVWEEGYQAGLLRGEIFPDVAPALRRWHEAGVRTAIFSSGSELAQRRLFESVPGGDLTPLIAAFFDTTVGSKRDPASYRRIATALDLAPERLLFVSDLEDELHQAVTAGCQTLLSVRPDNRPRSAASPFAVIHTFDEID